MSEIISKLEALRAKATPGRWEVGSTGMGSALRSKSVKHMRINGAADNLAHIAALHNAEEALLAVARAAERLLADCIVMCCPLEQPEDDHLPDCEATALRDALAALEEVTP